jgi:hypothetical protein
MEGEQVKFLKGLLIFLLIMVTIIMTVSCSNGEEEAIEEAVEGEIDEEPEPKPEAETAEMLTENDVIATFTAAELPVGEVIVYTEESCPNDLLGRPGQYVGKANWEDTRVDQFGESLTGGTVEVFDNQDALIQRKEYLEPILMEAMFLQYMYIHKNVIVRIDKELSPSQAEKYEQVLKTL